MSRPNKLSISKLALTARQRQALTVIRQSVRRRGYGPTVQEIGHSMGILSPNGVLGHLDALERKGYIRRKANLSRSIMIVKRHEEEPVSGLRVTTTVQGGFLVSDEESQWLDFSEIFTATADSYYVIRVSDHSLVNRAFCKDDLLVLRRCRSATVGEKVLLRNSTGEFILTECVQNPDTLEIFLISLESSEERKHYKNSAADVQGVLIAVLRMMNEDTTRSISLPK